MTVRFTGPGVPRRWPRPGYRPPGLAVVTWLWRQDGYHTRFGPEHVNVLRDAVARGYDRPHRFVCVTDDPTGLAAGVEVVSLGDYLADLPNPCARNGPSCYRRLRLFARDAAATFGAKRIVSLDLDTVVVGDLTPLWEGPDRLVLWRDPLFWNSLYNGSMVLLDAGVRPDVWEEFDPERSPRLAKAAGLFGSDQAWISYRLGVGVPTWGREDGVYSFRLLDDPRLRERCYLDLPTQTDLPAGARIVFFHGRSNPWDPEVRDRYPWVRDHYPEL